MYVPRLRFQEFAEKWESKKLGEIATSKSGKFNPENEAGFTKCIELEHLVSDEGNLLGYINGCNSGSIKNIFEKGDVLFGKLRPYLKKYLLAPFDGVCSSEIWVLKGTNISNDFLYAIVQTNRFIDLANQSSGSKMPRADWSVVSKGEFPFPTLSEQSKIANFLLSIDDKMSQLKKKKNLLEQYKKGVMQQLFSQELRFKDEDGNEFSEWEEMKIRDVFRFKQGVQCGVENQYSEIGQNMQRFIRIIDLTSPNEPVRYIDSPGEEHHIKQDDLFMVRYGTPGFVGYGFEGIIANNLFRIIPNIDVINKFYYFVFNFLSQEISKLASSSTMPALNFGSLEGLTIPMPSLPEQLKIASFLTSIDDKISQTALQIEKMQLWKKGLLQQMFV